MIGNRWGDCAGVQWREAAPTSTHKRKQGRGETQGEREKKENTGIKKSHSRSHDKSSNLMQLIIQLFDVNTDTAGLKNPGFNRAMWLSALYRIVNVKITDA